MSLEMIKLKLTDWREKSPIFKQKCHQKKAN